MSTYRVYCPEIPGKPIEGIKAASSYAARCIYATRHGIPVVEVIAVRLR